MMNNDLNPYDSGSPWGAPVPRESRKMAATRRDIYEEGHEIWLKEEVVFAIGRSNMMRAAMLDNCRQSLAGNDPGLNTVLCDIELNTLQQAKDIQHGLFNGER